MNRLEYLASRLNIKGASLPCPRCGHVHFTVLGESSLSLQMPGGFLNLGEIRGVPVTHVACHNCGLITTHATKALEAEPLGMFGGVMGSPAGPQR